MTQKWYTLSHQWLRVLGEIAVVGMSAYVVRRLNGVKKVHLPQKGSAVRAGGKIGMLFGKRTACVFFCPVSGIVLEVNEKALQKPQIVDENPEKEGWLFKLRMTKVNDMIPLLSKEQYARVVSFES